VHEEYCDNDEPQWTIDRHNAWPIVLVVSPLVWRVLLVNFGINFLVVLLVVSTHDNIVYTFVPSRACSLEYCC